MKLSRLFRLGKQGYSVYRSYRGKGGGYSSGYGGTNSGSGYRRSSGGTLERLLRRFLK